MPIPSARSFLSIVADMRRMSHRSEPSSVPLSQTENRISYSPAEFFPTFAGSCIASTSAPSCLIAHEGKGAPGNARWEIIWVVAGRLRSQGAFGVHGGYGD